MAARDEGSADASQQMAGLMQQYTAKTGKVKRQKGVFPQNVPVR
jgi:hypothetical protein